ncbi:hypothetical protein GCM10009117_02050 [Gangjinia marincola]|uniref:Arabinogalactan endo-beta-1,4-galactanase n=1 Tax=Gangjinia marincola TaxID=578463 RepID=A0ABN1MDG7_9FLAO
MRKLIFLVGFYATILSHGQCFTTGADLSYVNQIQANGGEYRDAHGIEIDPYTYFADRGANMIRLRLFHSPETILDSCGEPITASSLTDVLDAAAQVKALGMALNLSIHYSDYFADPGKQLQPQAWNGLTQSEVIDALETYTINVINALHDQNTLPDIISVGNETTFGFIDSTTETNGFSWPEDAEKFNTALNAIDAFNTMHGTSIKKALHFTESTAQFTAELFSDQGITNYDMIGLSYYPFFSPQIDLQELGVLIDDLINTYDKEVMIFETGFAWTTDFDDDYGNFISGNGDVLTYPTSAQVNWII